MTNANARVASTHASQRSLAFTLVEIFKEIPFGPAPDYKVSVNSRFRISLDRALELYRRSRQDALTELSRQKEISKACSLENEADLEEVFASCGHFSFSLLEFGEHLKELLTILDELQLEVDERPDGRSWRWIAFWRPRNPWCNDQNHLYNGRNSVECLAWMRSNATIRFQTLCPLIRKLEVIRIAHTVHRQGYSHRNLRGTSSSQH